MSFVKREADKIRASILENHPRKEELYAAQQALEWALEPSGIASPYAMITGIQANLEDCLAHRHPQSF
jgi:hypothetical protein